MVFHFVLPIIFSPFSWWQIVLGCGYEFVAGFILTVTFQLAHVVEGVSFPAPSEEGNMENEWMIHQLKTTANFAKNSVIFLVFVGVDSQIEHHLFPNICHIHYDKISDIVRATVEEYGMVYNYNKTYLGAVYSHYKMLKELGMQPILVR